MKPGKIEFGKLTPDAAKNVYIYEVGTPGELHVIHYTGEQGHQTMLSTWYPTAEEIRAMIEGNPIQLHIVGERHPWVKLEVEVGHD